MRGSGVLMPIFSLPGKYGIGCFSDEAYSFVDFLKRAGQRYWQILPLCSTGAGNSPYQSFSAFAGNPYFISPAQLVKDGLLKMGELNQFDFGKEPDTIRYEKLEQGRREMLLLAYGNFNPRKKRFQNFIKEQESWLRDYALFMALKEIFEGKPFWEWDEKYRDRDEEALKLLEKEHGKQIAFYQFVQFQFYEQWMSLKNYANEKGVEIIGDIPIYVAADSSDVWADPGLFTLNENYTPRLVAGCPPDDFSATGQLWGNPVYNWPGHAETGYEWWIRRMRSCMELYDVVRIDHFRAFDEYYAIPAGNETAEYGDWLKGPGMDLFDALNEKIGPLRVIAEDLGVMTDTVKKLLKDSGFPGMHLLEFAFYKDEDNLSGNGTSSHLPINYDKNSVVYPGTHDNETIIGWLGSIGKRTKKALIQYLGEDSEAMDDKLRLGMIRLAQASVADYALIPMYDWLGLDNRARINSPGTIGKHNWSWRMQKGQTTALLAKEMRSFAVTYGRI